MCAQQRCVYVTRFLLQHNMLIGEIEKESRRRMEKEVGQVDLRTLIDRRDEADLKANLGHLKSLLGSRSMSAQL